MHEAVNDSGFILEKSSDNTDFFIKENGEAQRYLIVHVLDQLLSVESIHEIINESLPDEMKMQPAFKKNCDLIIIYKVIASSFTGIRSITTKIIDYIIEQIHFFIFRLASITTSA